MKTTPMKQLIRIIPERYSLLPPVDYKGCICTSPESIIYLRGDSIANKHLQENIESKDSLLDNNESPENNNQEQLNLFHSFIGKPQARRQLHKIIRRKMPNKNSIRSFIFKDIKFTQFKNEIYDLNKILGKSNDLNNYSLDNSKNNNNKTKIKKMNKQIQKPDNYNLNNNFKSVGGSILYDSCHNMHKISSDNFWIGYKKRHHVPENQENVQNKVMHQSHSIEKLKREILLKKFEMIEKRRKDQENKNIKQEIINKKDINEEIFHKTQINYFISEKDLDNQDQTSFQKRDRVEKKEDNKINTKYKTGNISLFKLESKSNGKKIQNKSLNVEQHKVFRISKGVKYSSKLTQGLPSRRTFGIPLKDQINEEELIKSYPYKMLINLFTEFKGLYRAENYFNYNNLNMYQLEDFLNSQMYKKFKVNIRTVEELCPFFLGLNKEIKERILHLFC